MEIGFCSTFSHTVTSAHWCFNWVTDGCVSRATAAQLLYFIRSQTRTKVAGVTFADERDGWEGASSPAPLTHWFLFASFLAPPGSYCLVWELFVFCLLQRSLFFRVNGAHKSSVRTPDLCNYCPGLVYLAVLQLYLDLIDRSCGGIINVTGHYS